MWMPLQQVRKHPIHCHPLVPGSGSGAFEPNRREVDPGHAPAAQSKPHSVPAIARAQVEGPARGQPRDLLLKRGFDLEQLDGLACCVPLVPVRPAILVDVQGLHLRSPAVIGADEIRPIDTAVIPPWASSRHDVPAPGRRAATISARMPIAMSAGV